MQQQICLIPHHSQSCDDKYIDFCGSRRGMSMKNKQGM